MQVKTDNCTTAAIMPDIGRIVETRGVWEWLNRDGRRLGFARRAWRRYVLRDWGELDADDSAANDAALIDGGRIMAAYRFQGRKIWIITDAVGDDGMRAHTTIMFPSEY